MGPNWQRSPVAFEDVRPSRERKRNSPDGTYEKLCSHIARGGGPKRVRWYLNRICAPGPAAFTYHSLRAVPAQLPPVRSMKASASEAHLQTKTTIPGLGYVVGCTHLVAQSDAFLTQSACAINANCLIILAR